MRRATLIFNPVAGQGDATIDLANICDRLNPHFHLTVYQTSLEVTAADLAQQALQQGTDLVIVAGGDGTLSEVAGALLTTPVPMAAIAKGTANAFATALGIPLDIAGACEAIISGVVSNIDIARVDIAKVNNADNLARNTANSSTNHSMSTPIPSRHTCAIDPTTTPAASPNFEADCYCSYPLLLLAGIGLEAATIEGADRESKDRLGSLAYLMSALKQLQNLEPFQAELETSERIISCSASAITIANAAPATSVLAQGPAEVAYNDGLLDVTIFSPSTALGAIAASYHLLQTALQSQATDRQDIGYFKTNVLTIRAEPPQKVVIDGEILGTTPIRVECVPAGLSVILPNSTEAEPSERLDGLPDLAIKHKTEKSLV